MQRLCIASLMALLVAMSASRLTAAESSVAEAQQRRVEVVKKVAPSVVAIFGQTSAGGGSGVLISKDGFALSNFHVTSGSGNFMKCGLNDGVLYDAVIVGIDPTGDVALIKLLGRDDFPVATMGDSDNVQVGDWAYAMGNPFLLATDFQPTVTYGIVSGVHRYQYPAGSSFLEYTDCIQVDSSINPGNSGGPLFNDIGELVGINGRGSFEKRGRVNSGAGYAISINQIKHFLDHLRAGAIVDHATLGAAVQTTPDGRVVVASVLETSEAYRRGLRLNDEIVSFAGRPIRSVNQFKNILGIYPSGWRLPLTYRREEQKTDILARLRTVHTKAEMMPRQRPKPQPRPNQPKPKDGEKPKDGDKPKDAEPMPDEADPHHGEQPAAKPPEKYKHLFVEKSGFANWYFNLEEQKRLKPLITAWGDYSKQTGSWVVTGRTEKKDDFKLTLSDKGLGLQLGTDPYFQDLEAKEYSDEPPGSGGFLVAMHQLRLMLTKGDAGFSEYYYLGSEPLDLTGDRVDVLVTTVRGVQTRWYFTRERPTLVGFSSQLSEDVDECEVFFLTMREHEGRFFPGRILVRIGGRDYLILEVANVAIGGNEKS